VQEALATVRSKQAELERSNRELEQFAVIVSHDLREPLRTVVSFTQLLAQKYQGRLDQEAEDFIALSVEGAKRMEQRVEGLLMLAHIGTPGGEFHPTNLEAVLADVLADLSVQLETAGATVERDPLPTVRGNVGQLHALLQNLLTNAVKYRHPERRPVVRLSATKGREQWEIRVVDNGIGIAEQHHEDIFTVFHRLHPEAEYDGIGVGLTVCKKIVERHGGRIWVESTLGAGATFVCTFPA
jgi:light-regulated signal transduction histidine kinase (bacteriophytochrome)